MPCQRESWGGAPSPKWDGKEIARPPGGKMGEDRVPGRRKLETGLCGLGEAETEVQSHPVEEEAKSLDSWV